MHIAISAGLLAALFGASYVFEEYQNITLANRVTHALGGLFAGYLSGAFIARILPSAAEGGPDPRALRRLILIAFGVFMGASGLGTIWELYEYAQLSPQLMSRSTRIILYEDTIADMQMNVLGGAAAALAYCIYAAIALLRKSSEAQAPA